MYSVVHSYAISIKNEASYTVNVLIVYGGGAHICPNIEFDIKSGQTHNVSSGICCTSYITMKAMEGPVKGHSFTFQPPATGFGITCKEYSFVIKQAADGSLIGGTV